MKAPKVLFIGHDAYRTGAPLLLLELIKWLRANSNIRASVLLKNGGELEPEYQAVAFTRCHAREHEALNGRFHRRILSKLRLANTCRPILNRLYPLDQYPVIYANTIDTCDLAMQLVENGRRLIHHIHELSYITDLYGATKILQMAVPKTDSYIAASHSVREFLEMKIGVPSAKIHVVHEFPVTTSPLAPHNATRDALRRQLGIAEEAFIIGMCGRPDWRKGTDLFVQLASHVKRLLGPAKCYFVWVGGETKNHREALHDVEKLELQDEYRFIEAVRDPTPYFDAFDLFALTSREDPFSVAMLEAASFGLPIVCFAGAGGAGELVENDAGIIVPYLDVAAMAKSCVGLLLDDNRRRQLGDNARTKVQERYTLAMQGPRILKVIESTMALL